MECFRNKFLDCLNITVMFFIHLHYAKKLAEKKFLKNECYISEVPTPRAPSTVDDEVIFERGLQNRLSDIATSFIWSKSPEN